MQKMITNAGANEAGAWAFYSDGSAYRFSVATNQTVITNWNTDDVIVEGRFGC